MDALEGANFITNDSRFAVMILQKQYADWSGIKYRICELNNI
jgi:Holliday junction resolvase RusA-like endonuclease